jgi:hypothetical protein
MTETVGQESINGNANKVVATSPSEIPVPADYAKLGLMTGYNPRALEDARLYITGLAGEGKSTFVRSIPDSWVLDFEGGANGVPMGRGLYFDLNAKARELKIEVYELYRKVLDKLIADGKEGKHPCRRIVIDTQDAWVEMEGRQLLFEKNSKGVKKFEDIGELGQKGHGHSLLQGRCKNILVSLENAGYTWAVVGHLTYVSETDPVTYKESTKIRPLLSKGHVGPVVRKAELHITINSRTSTEKVDKEVNGRVFKGMDEKEVTRYTIYTRPTEAKAMEGKRRGVPQLVARMEVPMVDGWKVLKAAYDKAVEESRTSNGETK